MDAYLQAVYNDVINFVDGVNTLCQRLEKLSETVAASAGLASDHGIRKDCARTREGINGIVAQVAPHSSVAKLRRDLEYNIRAPIAKHITWNIELKKHLRNRNDRLHLLNAAQKGFEQVKHKGDSSRRYLDAKAAMELARAEFQKSHKLVVDRLYILDYYKEDILDSLSMTLKYLQYEFFSSAAHSIARALPPRIEFRPMIEMTPNHLQKQIDLEQQMFGSIQEESFQSSEQDVDHDAGAGVKIDVDELSLSSLVAQGIEDADARQALVLHCNDTQAALDWLLREEQRHPKLEEEQGHTSTESTTVSMQEDSFASQWVHKLEIDGRLKARPAGAADRLSLFLLESQGFEDAEARRALRMHNNDTQAALDWLTHDRHQAVPEDTVRMPTSAARVRRMRALREQQQKDLEHRKAQLEQDQEQIRREQLELERKQRDEWIAAEAARRVPRDVQTIEVV